MLEKILVALDGSKSAGEALDFALDLADKCTAEIVLLSVVHVPNIAYVAPSMGPGETFVPAAIIGYKEELAIDHEKILSDAEKKVKKNKPDLKVSTKLAEGRPADKIVETAQYEHCDLIVMGHRGLSGVKKLFLGSVSNRVADEATCPVLIVK